MFKQFRLDQIKEVENSRVNLGDLSDLMSSIKEKGLMNPVTISQWNGDWIVVAGHRRFNACKKLGLEKIQCNVVKVKNEADIMLFNLTENLQRKNTSPYEEGRYFHTLINDHFFSPKEISAKLGVSPSYVDTAISIFSNVPEKFKEKITYSGVGKNTSSKGKVPASLVKKIVQLRREFGNNSKKFIEEMITAASQGKISEGEIGMYGILKSYKKDLNIKKFMEIKDNIEVLRVNVPVLRDEINYCREELKMTKNQMATEVIYGELEPFKNPSIY